MSEQIASALKERYQVHSEQIEKLKNGLLYLNRKDLV